MDVKKIPSIMRANKWENGAKLMEHWFSGKSSIAPAYAKEETDTIKMNWVLSFERAKAAYNKIFLNKIYSSPAAQQEIANQLRNSNLLSKKETTFGKIHSPTLPSMKFLEKDYINYMPVGFNPSELDDLSAALGRFTFRVLVGGTVAKDTKSDGYLIALNRVGVFVKDSYDFNGDQNLGYWDPEDNSVSAVNPFGGEKVTNQDFQDWRTANKKGGDFIVFSDVRITHIPPEKFAIRQ